MIFIKATTIEHAGFQQNNTDTLKVFSPILINQNICSNLDKFKNNRKYSKIMALQKKAIQQICDKSISVLEQDDVTAHE